MFYDTMNIKIEFNDVNKFCFDAFIEKESRQKEDVKILNKLLSDDDENYILSDSSFFKSVLLSMTAQFESTSAWQITLKKKRLMRREI